ncbi:chalcone isomerase family protein [Alteromonas sp. SM 2104]|nr:chalcone isomerase family protein [Alteromonas oceanisediminis]
MNNNAYANKAVVEEHIGGAEVVGEARFEYFFWDVYDVKLYTPNGEYDPNGAFALSLTYLRDFDGRDIAERSVKEMRKQGQNDSAKLDDWLAQMSSIFPDVKEGQTLTGIAHKDSGHARFFLEDKQIGLVEDEEFTQAFFDIWLGEKTSEPKLRKRLLNR